MDYYYLVVNILMNLYMGARFWFSRGHFKKSYNPLKTNERKLCLFCNTLLDLILHRLENLGHSGPFDLINPLATDPEFLAQDP